MNYYELLGKICKVFAEFPDDGLSDFDKAHKIAEFLSEKSKTNTDWCDTVFNSVPKPVVKQTAPVAEDFTFPCDHPAIKHIKDIDYSKIDTRCLKANEKKVFELAFVDNQPTKLVANILGSTPLYITQMKGKIKKKLGL